MIRPSEKQIQEAVSTLLQLDGWRCFRTELTVQRERGRVVGEVGMADCQFVRYGCSGSPSHTPRFAAEAEVLWIEFKARGGRMRPAQRFWIEAERQRGALVLVVDNVDAFFDWYKDSGLCHKSSLVSSRHRTSGEPSQVSQRRQYQ